MRKYRVIALAASAVVAGLDHKLIAASATWSPTAPGNYSWTRSDLTNWSTGSHPYAAGDIATFNANFTGAQNVTLDADSITLGQLNIADTVAPFYPINISSGSFVAGAYPANTLVFDNGSSNAVLNNSGGTSTANDTISTPISLNSNLSIISSTGAAGGFTLSGVISNGTNGAAGILATGSAATTATMGTVNITGGSNTYTGSTTVDNGILQVTGNLNTGVAGALGNASTPIVLGSANSTAAGMELNIVASGLSSTNELSRGLDFSGADASTAAVGTSVLQYTNNASSGPYSNVLTVDGSVTASSVFNSQIVANHAGMEINFTGLITQAGAVANTATTSTTAPNTTLTIGATNPTDTTASVPIYRFANQNSNFTANVSLLNGIVVVSGNVLATTSLDSPIGHAGSKQWGIIANGNGGGNIVSADGLSSIRGIFLDTPGTTFGRTIEFGGGSYSTPAAYGGTINAINAYEFGGTNTTGVVTFSGYDIANAVDIGGATNYLPTAINLAIIEATGGTLNYNAAIYDPGSQTIGTQSTSTTMRITFNQARNSASLDETASGVPDANANLPIGSPTQGIVKLNQGTEQDNWTGTTEVMGGIVEVNNYVQYNAGEGGNWTIDAGASLQGYGKLWAGATGSTMEVYGNITPGDNTSTAVETDSVLQIGKQIDFHLGSSLTINLNSATNVTAANSQVAAADQLHVFEAGTANTNIVVDDTSLATEPLLNINLNYAPLNNAYYKIIDFDGTSTILNTLGGVGTFAVISSGSTTPVALTNGSYFTKNYNGSTYTFKASYNGGSGTDIVLTVTGPSMWLNGSGDDYSDPLYGGAAGSPDWSQGIPSAYGSTAIFGNASTGIANVTVGQYYSPSTIVFDDGNPGAGYNLSVGAQTGTGNAGAPFFGVQTINALAGYAIMGVPFSLSGGLPGFVNSVNTANNAQLLITANFSGGGNVNVTGTSTLTLSGVNTYNGITNVSGGTLIIANSQALPASATLVIGPLGKVIASNVATGAYALNLNTSSNTGLLDLESNAAIIHTGSTLGSIIAQLSTGYNNGNWNGSSGIVSSAAAANTTHLTALGAIINDTGANTGNASGTALYTSLEGSPTVDGDILVKYTYYGDANLSGTVDGSDYSLIDNGALKHLTGWYNGDFNYDGVVNGSDYTLIDNAFNTQGAAISAQIGSPTAIATAQVAGASAGSSAVPEPTTLGFIAIGAAGLLGRRRRRY